MSESYPEQGQSPWGLQLKAYIDGRSVPTEVVTQAAYDALTTEQRAGTLYLIDG